MFLSSQNRFFRRLLPIACVFVLTGSVLVVGMFLGLNQLFPATFIDRIQNKLERMAAGPAADEGRIIGSALLSIKVDAIHNLPASRPGRGGSLAHWQDETVVMTHAGDFYMASGAGAESLRIAAPENGLAALREELKAPRYKNLFMDFSQFRFLDVLIENATGGNWMFISYTEYQPEARCYNTAVARIGIPADLDSLADLSVTTEDWETIYRTFPCLPLKDDAHVIAGHMAGAPLALLDEDKLLMSSGDYHWDSELKPSPLLPNGMPALAQRMDNDYGKLLKISLSNGSAEIISSGLRNTKGLLIDTESRMWTVENGPRGGDELNLHFAGADFGWPSVSLGTRYSGEPWSLKHGYARHGYFDPPAFAWVPSIAPTEIIQLRGFSPAWEGDFLVGTMAGKSLHRLRLINGTVVYDEKIPFGYRIRALEQLRDGRIALWTDAQKLMLLSAVDNNDANRKINEFVAAVDWTESEKTLVLSQFENCLLCHPIGIAQEGNAPNLSKVFGDDIASTSFKAYSKALTSLSGRWTTARLEAFIADPQGFAPGTSMPASGVDDPAQLSRLVRVLEALASDGGSNLQTY